MSYAPCCYATHYLVIRGETRPARARIRQVALVVWLGLQDHSTVCNSLRARDIMDGSGGVSRLGAEFFFSMNLLSSAQYIRLRGMSCEVCSGATCPAMRDVMRFAMCGDATCEVCRDSVSTIRSTFFVVSPLLCRVHTHKPEVGARTHCFWQLGRPDKGT